MALSGERVVRVYALMDPRDGCAFYVGVTSRPLHRRLGNHVHDGRWAPERDERSRRIGAILAAGKRLGVMELETVADGAWEEAEQFWIAQLRALGCHLTNRAIGGPGALGAKQTAETQARRSAAAMGRDMSRLHTPEVWAKSAAIRRGRPGKKALPETRAKLSAMRQGPLHPHFGKHPSAATRAKMAAARRANPSGAAVLRGGASPHAKPVRIGGTVYPSGRDAAAALGCSPHTIIARIRRGEGEYLST